MSIIIVIISCIKFILKQKKKKKKKNISILRKVRLKMSYNFKSNLSEALGQLLKIGTDYNVIIQVGEGFSFKEFHAHSIILCCRSRYFNKILSDENIEKKDGKYIIKKPNISSQMFDDILK
jgi:hypothetical protein